MTLDRIHLRERREAVLRDMDELALQVDEGEVAADTAERLLNGYRQELDALETALDGLPTIDQEPEEPPRNEASEPSEPEASKRQPRSPRRVAFGAVLLLGALVASLYLAAQIAEPDADVSPGALTVDPSSVTNEELEAIVAANPEVTAMRMALADRYFEAEEYGASLDHYLYIADNGADPERGKALARVAWMAYITDQPVAADEYLLLSLEADPSNSEAILYRGFVTLYGLGDAENAVPQLEAAQELTNLSERVVAQIEEALDDARRGAP